MLAFTLAMSVVLQAALAPGNPVGERWDAVLSALTDAQMAVDRIGHCTTEYPARRDLEAEYQALFRRTVNVSRAAQNLHPEIDPAYQALIRLERAGTPRCTARALRSYSGTARRALAIAETGLRTVLHQATGLWLGSLHLCAGRVVAVEAGEPEIPGDRSDLILRFSGDFAPLVRALTAGRVGRPLSVVLDGVVITSPIVNEPVSDAISVRSPDDLPVDRIRAAVAEPC